MAPASDLPLTLWQANLDLQLRIAHLLQENGREWLDMGLRAVGEGAFEFDAETRALWRGGDWQALAAMPVETLWRQLEQRVGDGQALAQVALSTQDTFARGLASALQDWQTHVARALAASGAGEASPFDAWQAAFAVPPVAPAAPAARKRAPATPRTPVKQATSRAKGPRKRGG